LALVSYSLMVVAARSACLLRNSLREKSPQSCFRVQTARTSRFALTSARRNSTAFFASEAVLYRLTVPMVFFAERGDHQG
jgi:hypothetical protein